MRRKETPDILVRNELRLATQLWPGQIEKQQKKSLECLLKSFLFSVAKGDLLMLDHKWYVTHSGLLRLAHRRHCSGIRVQALREFCEPTTGRWVFRAPCSQRHPFSAEWLRELLPSGTLPRKTGSG